jgi:hypothetical protein
MSELAAGAKWIYGVLTTDATLQGYIGATARVYDTLAPENATMPFVTFQYQGGYDVRTNGPARIWASTVWLVKAIGTGSTFATLQTIAGRVDALLTGKYGSNTAGQVWCVREQPFQLLEVDAGVQYRHVGGLYRLWIREA